jgi:hypothetical protein
MWKEIYKRYARGGFNTEGTQKLLNNGYLAIYDENNTLKILSTNDFSSLLDLGKGNIFKVVSEKFLYISYGNTLKKLDLDNLSLETVCTTNEKNILIFNDTYCISSTLTRKPKWSYSYELKSLSSCDTYYQWNYKSTLYSVVDGDLVLSDESSNNKCLKRISPNTDTELWRFDFNDGSSGRRYMQLVDDILVVGLQYHNQGEYQNNTHYNLVGLNVNTGKVHWEILKQPLYPIYQYSKESKKLYTFGDSIFQVVNPRSGVIEKEIDFISDYPHLRANTHKNYLSKDGYLYFASNGYDEILETYLPQVGVINTDTHELESLVDIEIAPDTISRASNALNSAPIVHDNRMYIIDCDSNIHILENQ